MQWNSNISNIFIYLFIYGCIGSSFLCQGFLLLRQVGGHSSSRCAGLSLSWPLLLRSTGSRRAGSAIVAHRPSCSVACGILPAQGSNPCPPHWQADSQPLHHQGSPNISNIFKNWYSGCQPWHAWKYTIGSNSINQNMRFSEHPRPRL